MKYIENLKNFIPLLKRKIGFLETKRETSQSNTQKPFKIDFILGKLLRYVYKQNISTNKRNTQHYIEQPLKRTMLRYHPRHENKIELPHKI